MTGDECQTLEEELALSDRLCEDSSSDGDGEATEGDDVASGSGSRLLGRAALSSRGRRARGARGASSASTGNDGSSAVDTRNDGSRGRNWSWGSSSGSLWDG